MLRIYAGERAQVLQSKLFYRGYDLEIRRAASVAGWDLPSHSGSAYPLSLRGRCSRPRRGCGDGQGSCGRRNCALDFYSGVERLRLVEAL
jgi:hypothetical protein